MMHVDKRATLFNLQEAAQSLPDLFETDETGAHVSFKSVPLWGNPQRRSTEGADHFLLIGTPWSPVFFDRISEEKAKELL